MSPRLIALVTLTAATLAAALAARLWMIEPRDAAHLCLEAGAPWWCGLRDGLVTLFPYSAFGWASLALGLAALVPRCGVLGAGALIVGAAGLVLYDAETAAVGVVLGVIALVRGAARQPRTA